MDNDCDGAVDTTAMDAATWYQDSDGDGYGDASVTQAACTQPAAYVADATDCDDSDAATNPSAIEVCNGADDDCDGEIDEGSALDAGTWYADTDADGYGDPSSMTAACDVPTGYVADDTDCDDGDATASPAGTEVCDGIDNDCDGDTDEDLDADGGGVPDCDEVAVLFSYAMVSRVASYGLSCNGVDLITSEFDGTAAAIAIAGLDAVAIEEGASGVTTDLSNYAAIFVNNAGYSDALASATVTALSAANAAGIGIVFTGDDAIYSAYVTDASIGTAAYSDLMGLDGFYSNGASGTLTVVASAASHLVIDGPYGTVGSFSSISDMDLGALSSSATALMEHNGGYPGVWAVDDGAGHRTATYLSSIDGVYCSEVSGADVTEVETLLANAVDWVTGG